MPAMTTKTQQLAFRLAPELVAWLATEAARREAEEPGNSVNMSDVARALLTAACVVSTKTGESAYQIARSLVASVRAEPAAEPREVIKATIETTAPAKTIETTKTTAPANVAPNNSGDEVAALIGDVKIDIETLLGGLGVTDGDDRTREAASAEIVRAEYNRALVAGEITHAKTAGLLGYRDAAALSRFKTGNRPLPPGKLAELAKILSELVRTRNGTPEQA